LIPKNRPTNSSHQAWLAYTVVRSSSDNVIHSVTVTITVSVVTVTVVTVTVTVTVTGGNGNGRVTVKCSNGDMCYQYSNGNGR